MIRYLLFFLIFLSAIPSLWAHHYEVYMPIILDPARDNPYLDGSHVNSVYTRGQYYYYNDTYEAAPQSWSGRSFQGVFPYLCIAPQKDGKSLMEGQYTIPVWSEARDASLLTKKESLPGLLGNRPIDATVNLAFFGLDALLPIFRHNAGFACDSYRQEGEYWYTHQNMTQKDTLSLRVQYPVGTRISLPHRSFRILSNFSHQNVARDRVIRWWRWGLFALFPSHLTPKSFIIERLDGTQTDGMHILRGSHDDGESLTIPADTAVLHFTF